MKTNIEALERTIIFYMQKHQGVTMPLLATTLTHRIDDTVEELKIHGKQHQVSQAIERLRRRNLIEDVSERCPMCTRAKRTRASAVVLKLTTLGAHFTVGDQLPRQRTLREMANILNVGCAA